MITNKHNNIGRSKTGRLCSGATSRDCGSESVAESAALHGKAGEFFSVCCFINNPHHLTEIVHSLFSPTTEKFFQKSIKALTTTVLLNSNMTNGLVNGSTGIESQFGEQIMSLFSSLS